MQIYDRFALDNNGNLSTFPAVITDSTNSKYSEHNVDLFVIVDI